MTINEEDFRFACARFRVAESAFDLLNEAVQDFAECAGVPKGEPLEMLKQIERKYASQSKLIEKKAKEVNHWFIPKHDK